jgi:hypothetical protein
VADDGSSLNPSEQKLRDLLKGRLGTYATITKVKQTGDQIEVEVVSPNDFDRSARILAEAGPSAARQIGCNLDVKLTTSWPSK